MVQKLADRVDRLASDGKRGGGMPLPLLFGTILDELLAHGTRTVEDVKGLVEQATRKSERLSMIYPGSSDLWGDYVRDGFEQLEDRSIVARDGERWRLGPKFKVGERMIVIPARKGKSSQVGILVYAPEESEARSKDEFRKMEVISAYARLRRDGPGLRPLNDKHVETLVESMNAFGWLRDFPVLVDQDDHILDGRHRIAAAKRAGVNHTELKVHVEDAFEALGIAWAANESRAWSDADRKRISELVTAQGATSAEIGKVIGSKGMRLLIKARLLEHPEWADRRIANKLGCGHPLVSEIRAELEATGIFSQPGQLLGEDGRWYKNKRKLATQPQPAPPTPTATAPATQAEQAPPPAASNVVELRSGVRTPAIAEYKRQRAAGFNDATARERAGYTGISKGRGAIVNEKKRLTNKLLKSVDEFVAETSQFMELEKVLELVTQNWNRRNRAAL